MQHHMTAAVLSVGDEITLGQTLDTNSQWVAQRLSEAGIVPIVHLTVPDSLDAQRDAIVHIAAKVDLVIITGGLGPTADDLTRHALAAAIGGGEVLVEDPVALSQIEAMFVGRGREMPEINRVQALRPGSGMSLPNLNGTAPGLFAKVKTGDHSCDVICLPGPPREMWAMFEAQVMPRLRPDPMRIVLTRALHCFGIGESDLATRLGELMDRSRNPLVGTTASGGVVSIRMRFEGQATADEAARAMHATEMAARAAAGVYVFGSGDEKLPATLVRLLQERAQTVGTVESCTGGGLGEMITQVSGSSLVFAGGFITYSNDMKTRLVGVPPEHFAAGGPGAVSRETAIAMAQGGLARVGCTHCLSITGIAGPAGGSKEKPVGTVWIARASGDGTVDSRRFAMGNDRANIREWSCKCALAMLRFKLIGVDAKLLRQTEA